MKIKKASLLVAVCSLTASLFSGCATPVDEAIGELNEEITGDIVSDIISDVMSDIDDYDDGTTTKKEQLEIYSAEDNSILYTTTDINAISTYMENVVEASASLKYLSAIPSNAEALYIYVLQQEDLDSELPIDERPLLEAMRSTLYKNDKRYYMAVQFDDKTGYISLSNATSENLINLANGKDDNTSADDESEIYTEKDVAAVSTEQKIEICTGEDETAFSTTDISVITDILNATRFQYEIDQLPDDSKAVCTIKRFTLKKKQIKKELVLNSADILYSYEDEYYIERRIPYIEKESGDEITHYKVAAETAAYIISYIK